MKKMFSLLITLFIIYLGIQVLYNFLSNGHDINYLVKTNGTIVNIHEILTLNKEDINNYLIEVSYNNKIIPFKIYKTYGRNEKVVKSVDMITEDNYTCAYMTIDTGDNPSDIKCEKDGVVYLYSEIKGRSQSLDRKISNMVFYETKKYIGDEQEIINKDDRINVFLNNLPSNQTIMLEDYKGIYLIGENVTNNARFIKLFNNDIYSKNISYLVDQYYIVADYNMNHEFNILNVINMATGSEYKINLENYISFNSFVQGSEKDNLYLVDKDAKKQYKINIRSKHSEIVGNEELGAKIYNFGEWTTQNINDVIKNNITFNNVSNVFENVRYNKVILYGTKNSGVYYLIKENNNLYDVYSVYANSKVKNYLFTATSNQIYINKGFIYYINNDNLMMYSDEFSKRKILTNNELKYNNNLKFVIY